MVTILFVGEIGMDGADRPGADDVEQSGTSQDHGMLLSVTRGFVDMQRSAWSPIPDCQHFQFQF